MGTRVPLGPPAARDHRVRAARVQSSDLIARQLRIPHPASRICSGHSQAHTNHIRAAIVGRSILLNGEPHTLIGVLPASGEFDRRATGLWVPLVFPSQPARDYHYLTALARLKPGVSLQQAQAELSGIAEGIATRYPDIKKGWGAHIDRYVDRLVGPQTRQSLIVLMCAVAAVLLIACANLANLLMARATLRSREIALRLALGVRRGRVIRMLLTESLLLSALGAVVGVLFG